MLADVWKILAFVICLTVAAGIAQGASILTIIIFLITMGAAIWITHRRTRNWPPLQTPDDVLKENGFRDE